MRILIVTPWFPTTGRPESGIFVAREAQALAETHEVSVIHVDANATPGESVTIPGVTVDREAIRLRSLASHAHIREVVRTAASDADVVHTHALPGLIPWLLGRPGAAAWVHTEHWSGLTAPETLTRFERAIRSVLLPVLRRPDVVVTECERLAAAVRRHRRGPVAIVPCIVPSVDPAPLPAASEPLSILSVGGLIPRKGPGLAVDAIEELRRSGIDARLTWVGDGPLRAALEERVAQAGLTNAVRFTGSLDSPAVSDAFAQARLFLLPTQGDNFCVVAAEALVHGRPLVSGAATGAVDYADPTVSEFVADQHGSAYAAAVCALVQRTSALTSAQIAETVEGRFSPERVNALLSEIYVDAT